MKGDPSFQWLLAQIVQVQQKKSTARLWHLAPLCCECTCVREKCPFQRFYIKLGINVPPPTLVDTSRPHKFRPERISALKHENINCSQSWQMQLGCFSVRAHDIFNNKQKECLVDFWACSKTDKKTRQVKSSVKTFTKSACNNCKQHTNANDQKGRVKLFAIFETRHTFIELFCIFEHISWKSDSVLVHVQGAHDQRTRLHALAQKRTVSYCKYARDTKQNARRRFGTKRSIQMPSSKSIPPWARPSWAISTASGNCIARLNIAQTIYKGYVYTNLWTKLQMRQKNSQWIYAMERSSDLLCGYFAVLQGIEQWVTNILFLHLSNHLTFITQ